MTQKRSHSEISLDTLEVFRSNKINEQTSSFVGAFSPSLSTAALQRLPEFRTATHRIAAWRKPSRQKSLTLSKSLFDTGHDDDGESWAGGRLARVLNDTQVSGTVVVARWYGGQNIGPIRFAHIENCAKEAIWKWKVSVLEAEKAEASKKQRIDDDAKRKELIAELAQRDHSISALRGLLAEKKAKLSGEDLAPSTPQKAVQYEKMGLDVLKRLDKARDATIAAILRQMDKVDEDLALLEGLDDDALDELEEPGQVPVGDSSASKEDATTLSKMTEGTTNDLDQDLERTNNQDGNTPA
ncbi:hypothetical protein OPT61_g8597 [Boeremia exigua]|uniref:Uncharacterized protein n=1 Tax=Boeremia exigua TaxID=749465 RepID=A0ACC2HY57_9PLEO|nr:hypothetical protein OPT61_g8597 [Boeremia exigua]